MLVGHRWPRGLAALERGPGDCDLLNATKWTLVHRMKQNEAAVWAASFDPKVLVTLNPG